MMVTVCQPSAGYGYHAYGHNYCKEAQETGYKVPVLTVVEPAVDVTYPEPIKTCVNKTDLELELELELELLPCSTTENPIELNTAILPCSPLPSVEGRQ